MIKSWKEYLKEGSENSPFNTDLITNRVKKLKELIDFEENLSCDDKSCILKISLSGNTFIVDFSSLKVSKETSGKREEKILKNTPLLIGIPKCLDWLENEIKKLV